MSINKHQSICERIAVTPQTPVAGTKLGFAMRTIGELPINGLRHKPANGTNGWYIWCGEELLNDDGFFVPLHVEHIENYLPNISDYLSLPPGYRFLIDGDDYEDVWFDQEIDA
jgi:hypothetical protein